MAKDNHDNKHKNKKIKKNSPNYSKDYTYGKFGNYVLKSFTGAENVSQIRREIGQRNAAKRKRKNIKSDSIIRGRVSDTTSAAAYMMGRIAGQFKDDTKKLSKRTFLDTTLGKKTYHTDPKTDKTYTEKKTALKFDKALNRFTYQETDKDARGKTWIKKAGNAAINVVFPLNATKEVIKDAKVFYNSTMDAGRGLASAVTRGGQFAKDFIHDPKGRFKKGITHVWDRTQNAVGNLYNNAVKKPIENVKNFAHNVKDQFIDRPLNAVRKAANTVSNVGKKIGNAGKSAASFINKLRSNKGRADIVKKASDNVAGKVQNVKDKYNNAKDKLNKAKDAVRHPRQFARQALSRAWKRGKQGVKDKVSELMEKLLTFLQKNARIIVGAAKIGGIAIVLWILFMNVLRVATIFQGIGFPNGSPSPHYYCDLKNPPGLIKNEAAYKRYCKNGMDNSSIAKAALSLIDPEYVYAGKVGSGDVWSSITEQYQAVFDAMDALGLVVNSNDGTEGMPYANCIGFTTTVLAYAGVDESAIAKGNPSTCVGIMQGQSDFWEEVSFDGFESLEPGDVIMTDEADGSSHTYIYIGSELMQEEFPMLPSDFIIAEAAYSKTPGKSYGGVASNRQDTWLSMFGESGTHVFRYIADLDPRDVAY